MWSPHLISKTSDDLGKRRVLLGVSAQDNFDVLWRMKALRHVLVLPKESCQEGNKTRLTHGLYEQALGQWRTNVWK